MVGGLGTLAGLGLVRRRQPLTWIATGVVFAGFFIGMNGLLRNESVVVRSPEDTLLGFQPGTAYLIYGIWVLAFFTLAGGFSLLFNRLGDGDRRSS
jgi:hypothetical protein